MPSGREARGEIMTVQQPPLTERFFWPESMAFVGATSDLTKLRGRLFAFTRTTGYTGKLYPISSREPEIGGYPCHARITDVKAPIDLAVVAVPAKYVPDAVEDCAAAGAKTVMIISSGFAEEGGAATELQARILDTARRTGIRIAGPNSEGFWNGVGNVCATFSPVIETLPHDDMPHAAPHRRIGIVSQSGGMGFAIFTRGRNLGLTFSHVVSTGNEADLSAADYMGAMVGDPDTQVIVMLCETIRDGAGFCRAAKAAAEAGKPVIVCKLGRSDAGARAAASHTAALTGTHSAYRAVFRKYGILEATDTDEAVAIAAAVATCPLPRGRRVGIVTASGGGGTAAADIFSDFGLSVPELSPTLQARIETLVPPHASALNPVDTTAQGQSTGPVSAEICEMMEASGEVDMLVAIVSAAREKSVSLEPGRIKAILERGALPMLAWTYTLASKHAKHTAAQGGSVLSTDARHVGLGLSKLADYADHLRAPADDAGDPGPVLTRPPGAKVLREYEARRWLSGYGLGGAGDVLADTPDAAIAAAEGMGYPVVLKIQSPDILHKTEVGGVRVNLPDAAAVRAAFGDIVSNTAVHAPAARVDGVLVQKMAPRGVELVVGVVNDATFGPIVMLGAGGVSVELFGDVVHYPAPFGPARAEALLRGLKSAPLFDGFRGAAPIDLAPAAALISLISHAAAAGRDIIAEMEFNPVILHSDGSGISVADAVVIFRD